ncbi:MAG: MBL fold metallo-hydrolase [Pirellulales bacterium]
MIVHCLGTTGYHPSPSRHTACYYLPEQSLVLDAGTGMFRLTQHLLEQPKATLDIFLSHAHLDHVMGLTFLLDTFAVTALKHVRVFGLSEKLLAVREHLFNQHLFPVWPAIELVPIDDLSLPFRLADGSSISWFPLVHPGGSLGFRIETRAGSLAYVTDTTTVPDSIYRNRLQNLKLLMHECYFNDDYRELAIKTGHSWLNAVEELVSSVRPDKTLLIHINPLAEILNSPLRLTDRHRELGMIVPEDLDTYSF